MSTELEFIIKRKNLSKTVSAKLIINKGNYGKQSVNINNDILNLLKFSTNFSLQNNINIKKEKNFLNNTMIEKITFEKGNFIITNFNKNLIIDNNKYNINRKLVFGTVIGLAGILGIGFIHLSDAKKKSDNAQEPMEQSDSSINVTSISDLQEEISNNESLSSLNITVADNDYHDLDKSNTSVGNIELFSFKYEDRSNSDCISEAKNNISTLNKYGERYGIDPTLLIAMMCQESSGIHKEYSENGHAIGAFQIENVWANEKLTAYNFETKEMETIVVDYDKLKDFDYNTKVASMILQYNMRNFDYNVPQALQAYNMGLSRVKGFGDDWNTARLYCDKGDSLYIEHVFSYLMDGHYLTMKKPDGSSVNYILDNVSCSNYDVSSTKQQ